MSSISKINITIKDVIWNYAGSILNLGMNLFILPIILNVLPSNELGLWYVFSSVASLITLLDFGFSSTISRNVTCAWCGAAELKKEGLGLVASNGINTNLPLLKSLLNISKKIYMWISMISTLILLTVGTVYIYSLVNQYNNPIYYLIAWLIYVISIIINMYYSYWNAFLRGIGALKQLNQAAIISRSLFIIISIIGLLSNGGLIAIAIAQIVSGLVLRLLCKMEFLKLAGKEFLTDKIERDNNEKVIFRQLLPNTTKYGMISVGGFMSQRADTLLCSSFLGLEATSRYGLTMQLLNLLGSISQLLFSSYTSQITEERLNGNKKKVITLFSISISFQFLVGIIGILVIVFIGPWILDIIGTDTELLPKPMILVIGMILLFEWNTSVFLNFLMTSNKVPFVKTSIFSGIFIVVCSYLLLVFTNLEVFALIIGRAIVGFGFNNWYWPRYVCKELSIKFYKLVGIGLTNLYKYVSRFIKHKLNLGDIKYNE